MTAIPPRLTIVTLGVRDFDTMRSFYDGLGFTASFASDEFMLYVLGGVGLGLFPIEQLAAEAGAEGEPAPGDWRGFSLALNLDTKEEVDTVYDAWVAAGATVMERPVDRSFGGRTGYVADPEGNRWEIAWVPSTTFDDRGGLVSFG